jgi:hypothetical protein
MRCERLAPLVHHPWLYEYVGILCLGLLIFIVPCDSQQSGQELTGSGSVVVRYENPVTLNITAQSYTSMAFTINFERAVTNFNLDGNRFALVGCAWQGLITAVSPSVYSGSVVFTDNLVHVGLLRFAATDGNGNTNLASNTLSLTFADGHNAGEGIVVNGDLVPWEGTICIMPADRGIKSGYLHPTYLLDIHEFNDEVFRVPFAGNSYVNRIWYDESLMHVQSMPPLAPGATVTTRVLMFPF